MQSIVFDKPYVPVPPYAGKLWPWALGLYLPTLLRRRFGVTSVRCVGTEKLVASVRAGHGVMITPNHSRDEDPFVLSALGRQAGVPFYVVASAHLFMESKVQAFLLRRAGAFSIYREGMDKQAVATSIEILEQASRPLVIFPEGHISRTNDRIAPMLEGTALIARQAAKKRAKDDPAKKVVIHPVAIRYAFNFDVRAAVEKVLEEIEVGLTWRPARDLPVEARLHRIGAALLALKELEYVGHTQEGTIADRIAKLIDVLLVPLENEWANANHDGHPVTRVKRLRSAILPDMIKGDITDEDRDRRWRQLADAYLAQQLYHYPPDYVVDGSPVSRMLETVERFEEDLTDKVRVHGPVSATVTVGEPIEVPTGKGEIDVMDAIDAQIHTMLGIARTPDITATPTPRGANT
jgi:1-acyl-sn-glycerol-3-phosphate acyltransferase